MRASLLLSAALAACLTGGCGKGEEAEFEGRPFSEWLALAKSGDTATRCRAYDGLRAFPSERAATDALRGAMNNTQFPPGERVAAARNLYRATGDAGEVVQCVRGMLKTAVPASLPAKELEDLAFWLGARAQPLVPDFQDAHRRATGRDAATVQTRATLQRILENMPKD
jgi:hypothetical protein